MASNSGTATIDFGSISSPKTETSVTVTGQTGLLGDSSSRIEAWVRGEATTEHSVDEVVAHTPRVLAVPNGAGQFIIRAWAHQLREYGTFKIDWVWMQ